MKKIFPFFLLVLSICSSCESNRIKRFLIQNNSESNEICWHYVYDGNINYLKHNTQTNIYSLEKYNLRSKITTQIASNIYWHVVQTESSIKYLQKNDSGKWTIATTDFADGNTTVINDNIEKTYFVDIESSGKLDCLVYFDGETINMLNYETGSVTDRFTPNASSFAYSDFDIYFNQNDTVYVCNTTENGFDVKKFAWGWGELIAIKNNFATFYNGFYIHIVDIEKNTVVQSQQLHREEAWLDQVEHNNSNDVFLCYSYEKLAVVNFQQESPSIQTYVYFENIPGRVVSPNLNFWNDGHGYRYQMDDNGNLQENVPSMDSYLESNDISILREFHYLGSWAVIGYNSDGKYLLVIQGITSGNPLIICDLENGPIDLRIDFQYISYDGISEVSYSNNTISGVVKDGDMCLLVEFDPLDINMDANILARGRRIYKLEENKYQVYHPDGHSNTVRTSGYSYFDNYISDFGSALDFIF